MQHCSSAWWLWTFSAICLNLDFWFYIFFIASQIIISRAIKIHFILIDLDTIMASGHVNFIKIYWVFLRNDGLSQFVLFFCLFLCENFMKHLGRHKNFIKIYWFFSTWIFTILCLFLWLNFIKHSGLRIFLTISLYKTLCFDNLGVGIFKKSALNTNLQHPTFYPKIIGRFNSTYNMLIIIIVFCLRS